MVTSPMTFAGSLGVERDAVILHVDDLGMCHDSNLGFLSLARQAMSLAAR